MACVNGNRREGVLPRLRIKELIHCAAPRPSWLGTNNRLFLPTGEGAPSKNEGVGGAFKMGFGDVSPTGFGQRPRSFCLCGAVTLV